MRRVGGEWLNTGIYIKTLRGCVAFFLSLLGLFGHAGSIAASEAAVDDPIGHTLAVTASVPLTPEFAYSIRKNSSLLLEQTAFISSEEVRVAARIAGAYDEPLRGHKISLQVTNTQRGDPLTWYGETDANGLVHFTFVARADFLGRNILQAADMTYIEPIFLTYELSFLVSRPEEEAWLRVAALTGGHFLAIINR